MIKKISKVLILFLFLILILTFSVKSVFALDGDADNEYSVYLENGEFLFEKSDIMVGDEYLSKDFKLYKIIRKDDELKKGYAEFVREIKKPNVTFGKNKSLNSSKTNLKQIGLYLTHNDESYVPSDGYDSVYGKGGIHDVAKTFKQDLEKFGINVVLDETLHIPHDSSAYSRSMVTAKKLLGNNDLNAIFDIHRDGASRSFYVTTVDGEEKCHVRMVVGKANPNKSVNETFAVYLMSIADQIYPWLFSDIYFATGHYNQNLFEKSLLFEMGSHLVEKDLVLKSMPALADVVNRALYNSVVDDDENITVGGEVNNENENINDKLTLDAKNIELKNILIIVTSVFSGFTIIIMLGVYFQNKKLKK